MGGREGVLARDRRDGARHGGVARAAAGPGTDDAGLVAAAGRGAAVRRVRYADRDPARAVPVGARGTDSVRVLAGLAVAGAGGTGRDADGGRHGDPPGPVPSRLG